MRRSLQPGPAQPPARQRMGAATHVGQRSTNEDSFCLFDLMLRRGPDQPLAVLAVADGMGGHTDGATASRMAVQQLDLLVESGGGSGALRGAVERANEEIWRFASSRGDRVGTTLTAAVIEPGMAWIAHVGDSRAYLIHGRSIMQITEDHSLVGDLLRKGAISEREAQVHAQGNVLHRALGVSSTVDVDMVQAGLGPGDVVVLCSDGLASMVSTEEILEQVEVAGSMETAASNLISLALGRGGDDNITVVLWRYPGGRGDAQRTMVGTAPVVQAQPVSKRVRRVLQVLLIIAAVLIGLMAGYQVGSLL